jgi:SRSO17 transposase
MTQPRSPTPTIKLVDEYCAIYQNLFPEIRSFENFRNLHLGMISEIKRKSLPEIATVLIYECPIRLFRLISSFLDPHGLECGSARRICHQILYNGS